MKFTELAPGSRSCAIHALLSFFSEGWQSEQLFVSRPRTVCGTYVQNAVPAQTSALTVCACEWGHSRFWCCDATTTAHADRTGLTLLLVTLPSMPSMYASSRSSW